MAAAAWCAACGAGWARQDAAPPVPATLGGEAIVEGKVGEKLDDYLSRLEAFGFNGAVLYGKKDRVFLRKAYGYACREEDRKNTPETLFDIASVTKQFTCAGILRLQMEGKLSTADSITKFFPSLGKDKEGVYLYHLMNNTSGLPQAIEVTQETKDRDEFIEILEATPLENDPDERWAYNNINFCLLAAVIEVVSGKRYETFMHEQIFAPAGLRHVHFLGETIPRDVPVAMAHRGDWEMWSAEEAWFSWALRGAAGTLCSLDDLYRWELALRGDAVLSREAKLELFNRFVPTYAYGWMVRDDIDEKRTVFHHGGNTAGFQAHYERCMKDGSVVIILINDADRIGPLTNGVRGIIEGFGFQMPPKPFPMTAERLAEFAGTYEMEGGKTIELAPERGALVLKNYGRQAAGWRLKGRSETDVKRGPRYDRMADEAAQAFHAGELAALEQLFPEGQERRAGMLALELKTMSEAGGGERGIDVIGTLPRTLQEVHTFVALRTEKREEVIKLLWNDGQLASWDHTYPGVMRFVPVGDGEFISYEITAEVTPRDRAMKFVLDEQGKPAKVAILIDFERQFGERRKE